MKRNIPQEFLDEYYQRKEGLESELKSLREILHLRLKQLNRMEGTRARLTDSRVKRPAKIWKNAVERAYSPSKAFKKIIDILGLRIVCNNLSDVQSVVEMLKHEAGLFENIKIHDMVSNPRKDGYRAIHVRATTRHFGSARTEGIPCEIQIRTLSQDTWGRLSREDIYGKNLPKIISGQTKILSDQLAAIDKHAQLIRNELDKPAEIATDIKDSNPVSPNRLALLYKQKYDDDLYEWSLHDWMLNLEEAEVETIQEVKEILEDTQLRNKLDDVVKNIREYPLKDSEWVVFSAKVAADISEEEGFNAVIADIESEWNEITSFALREMLPGSIEDFISELEFSLTVSKDALDTGEEIESYLSLLGCISIDMYGIKSVDEVCAVEAITFYYEAESYEERVNELISEWAMKFGY